MEQSKTIILTGVAIPESDDNGMASIIEVGGDDVFVRLQSWSQERDHPVINQMVGRRIKITIEVGDDVVSDLIAQCDEAETLSAKFERKWRELHRTGYVQPEQDREYAAVRQSLYDRIAVLQQRITDFSS